MSKTEGFAIYNRRPACVTRKGHTSKTERWIQVASLMAFFAAAEPLVHAAKGDEREDAQKRAQKHASLLRAKAITRGEPTAKEVQRATLRYYRLEPERINRMCTAARMKGLIPEVETGVDNLIGHSFTNTRNGLYPNLPPDPDGMPNNFFERAQTNNDQLLWRVRAVWNLDRLAFNAEELDAKSLNSLEENLLREVTTLYYARRRLLTSLIVSPSEDEEELYYEQLRVEEMTSTLDAFSGGMFGKRAHRVLDEER
jgi:hypothetical protein